jgi:hypothetical protein
MSYEIKFFKGRKKVYTLIGVKDDAFDEAIETMKRYHGFDRVNAINYDNHTRRELLLNER